ncbi:MAG: hypothetical protein ACI4P3_06630 [Candidatus Spyradosoma sp.]
MFPDIHSLRRRFPSRRGFSLVVSLVMMALMLMVAITLVSFVYVQSKLTESRLKRSQAQLNAISGMRMALGQLQLLSGDDQRVTATADIFGGSGNASLPGGKAVDGKRFWTGVWATGGLDKTKLRDWSIYSPDKKPFLGWLVSDYSSTKEIYTPLENPLNRESASGNMGKTLLGNVQKAFEFDDENLDLVTLVGAGTLGSERDAADELTLKQREVRVRRVPIMRFSASSNELLRAESGSFAYWVGDEGVKAKISIPDGTAEKFVKKAEWEQLFNVSAQKNGVSLLEGLSRFDSWWEKDAESATVPAGTRLGYVDGAVSFPVYAEALGGNAKDVEEAAKKLFHDVSFVSKGVFSDVYNGGLKTDLSLAFEMPWFKEGSWTKGFRDVKQFHGSGEKNDLNLLNKFRISANEKWWTTQPTDGLGYLYEITTGETSRNESSESGIMDYLRGPTWDLVRNYYRLYKRTDEKEGFRNFKAHDKNAWIAVGSRPYSYLSGQDSNPSQVHGKDLGGWFGPKFNYSRIVTRNAIGVHGQWASLLPEFNGKLHNVNPPRLDSVKQSLIVPQSMRIAPVVRRIAIRFAVVMNQDTAAICFDPVFVMHNPYNVPLEFYGFGAYWTKFFPFKFRLNRLDVDETTGKPRNWPGTDSPTKVYEFKGDLMGGAAGAWKLAARVFAAGSGNNVVNQFGKSSSGYLRMEPGEVKAVFPCVSTFANQQGYILQGGNTVMSLGDFQYEEKSVAAVKLTGIDLTQIPQTESLMFSIDVGPYDGSYDRSDDRYSENDIFTFNLFYPQNSEGSSMESWNGVTRIWAASGNMDVADISDENLVQVIAARRHLPEDGSWMTNVSGEISRGTDTGIENVEKNYFAYINIQDLSSGDSPLAGPFATNARPWVVDPRSWDANMKERNVGIGWKKTLEKDMLLNPVEFRDKKGFWGDGVSASDGQTNIVLFEIPTAPLVSLGQLQHVECSVLEMEPSYVVGNSYPHIGFKDDELDKLLVWPDAGYMKDGAGPRYASVHSPQPRGDTPFAANASLFDRYFFSGINVGDANTAQCKDMDEFVRKVFSTDPKDNPFPNKRVGLIRDFGDRKEADVKKDFYDPEKVSRNLLFDGSFNVNSTSVEAWVAVLSGLRGKLLQVDGKFKEMRNTPFARFMALIGRSAGGFGGKVADNDGDDGNGWRWYSELSDSNIRKLAEAIVDQVRERGPFMSMGDFVNRRLTTEETGKAGALQAAIDESKINKDAQSGFNDGGSASNPDSKRFPNLFPTKTKSKKAGVPGYVTQGDILANVGAGLSARSDTFTIRAYGDVFGLDGTPEARAWCEAVVQRVPEFFAPQDDQDEEIIDSVKFLENYRDHQADDLPQQHVLDKWERDDRLSAVNKLFGRRYKVVAFRWLSQNEL